MKNTAARVISTESLAKILGQNNLKILDCSSNAMRDPSDCPRVNFLRSHIKTAKFLDLDYFKDFHSNLPYMMPTKVHFIDTLKRLDVRKSDKVVCYDTHFRNVYGFRVAWMFDSMGHPDV